MNVSPLILALFLVSVAAAQDTTDAPRSAWPHLEAEVGMSNIYESNIDHDVEATPSIGLVPALRLRVQDRAEDARLSLDYVLARHSYTNVERWNRTSHQVRMGVATELLDGLEGLTEAEVSLRGSSEDRDLANQIQLVQGLEWKVSRAIRVEGYGTLRYKTVPGNPNDRAFKPNTGLNLQHRWTSGARVEVGSRYELNVEPEDRGDYRRLTLDAEVRIPTPGRESRIELGTRWRIKRYLTRLAEDADGDEIDAFRVDQRWTTDVTWQGQLIRGVGVEAGVQVEQRVSTDADKHYTAASLLLGVGYRF
ncbi:MAG: hypothetical protein Rubg2KO_29330 [Rubricoccaceae bacterium]